MKKLILAGLLLGSISAFSSEKAFIVPSGKVYHRVSSCKTLSRSKNVQAVSVKQVGNRKPCKVC